MGVRLEGGEVFLAPGQTHKMNSSDWQYLRTEALCVCESMCAP